jgi:hypothetical protein
MNTRIELAPPWALVTAPSKRQHKLIITGTGRAGTTFLVRLLTALGQDTGYDAESWRADYFAHCDAGLERNLADPAAPYIVKDPALCVTLDGILREGQVVVDHAIVPVRDLESAALSRVRIGGGDGTVPGGLVGTDDPGRQQSVLAERFHNLVHTLVEHDVPHTFMLFPRFVYDAEYAFEKLSAAIPELDRNQFMTAYERVADPTKVHDFGGATLPRSVEAVGFERLQSEKRQGRRLRRVAASTAAVLVLGAVAWWMAHVFSR